MLSLAQHVLGLQVILLAARSSQALKCDLCNETDCAEPVGCRGGTVPDVCACCTECAKVENESCGGVFGTGGTCDEGLKCVKREPFIQTDYQNLPPVDPDDIDIIT